jgi:hypothetical protein
MDHKYISEVCHEKGCQYLVLMQGAEPTVKPGSPRHGIDCTKVAHNVEGLLHAEDDDKPYDVDGVMYCGRCHQWIRAQPADGAEGDPGPAEEVTTERDNAVRWIGVVTEELVNAGFPTGDRTVQLANIRQLIREWATYTSFVKLSKSDPKI